MTERTCGGCTACCTTLSVDEIAKPADRRCPHQGPRGCAIYERRPGSCRRFRCLWLDHPELPEDYRPDKLGVVLHYGWWHENPATKEQAPFLGLLVWPSWSRPLAWREMKVLHLINAITEAVGKHTTVAILSNHPKAKHAVAKFKQHYNI